MSSEESMNKFCTLICNWWEILDKTKKSATLFCGISVFIVLSDCGCIFRCCICSVYNCTALYYYSLDAINISKLEMFIGTQVISPIARDQKSA